MVGSDQRGVDEEVGLDIVDPLLLPQQLLQLALGHGRAVAVVEGDLLWRLLLLLGVLGAVALVGLRRLLLLAVVAGGGGAVT